MRVLITGAARFLGSHLVDRFLAGGAEVIGMDNLLTGRPENLAHLSGHPRFRFHQHDVTNFIFVEGPLDGVLHFASPASPIDYLELPIQTLKAGSLGTHMALGLAKAKKARFLLASTSEVYGDPLVHPQPESYWGNVNLVGPRGVYDEAKRGRCRADEPREPGGVHGPPARGRGPEAHRLTIEGGAGAPPRERPQGPTSPGRSSAGSRRCSSGTGSR
jgi:hypothetical protein